MYMGAEQDMHASALDRQTGGVVHQSDFIKRGGNKMNIPCVFEERISKEDKPYSAIFIKISDTYEKGPIFLEKAEIELLRLTNGAKPVKINPTT